MRSGYKATVPYLVAWADAFHFVDQVMGSAKVIKQGPITWTAPYRFPPAAADLYAQRFTIEPVGASGGPLVGYDGLRPGEYFDHALITLEFETPGASQTASQVGIQNHQLDPANPITQCEMSVKINGRMETVRFGTLAFPDNSPVLGDAAFPASETRLVLNFPRVPYLPWEIVQPYINGVNTAALWFCARGSLLFTGMDTKYTPQPDGSMGQQVQFEFSYNANGRDWNALPDKTGTYQLVHWQGGTNIDTNRVLAYVDFSKIFANLQFVGS